jgi:hypothetical protein
MCLCQVDVTYTLHPNSQPPNPQTGFRHLLVVFGGVAGLEACVDASEDMRVPAAKTHTLFDVWLNVCPDQGSRTIRTEEAVPITLAQLRPLIVKSGAKGKAPPPPVAAVAGGGGDGGGASSK